MDKICSFIFILGFCFVNARVHIQQLNVPNAEVGKNVTLDCIFKADEELELIWYYNNDTIYKWVPGHFPKPIGVFQNWIDAGYKASDDYKTMYRALRLIDVKAAMTGNYTCEIIGKSTSDSKTRPLNLYSRIHIIDLKVPDSVPLAVHDDIILDCEYIQGDTDLEIKWFFNDDIHMIYQWIPGQPPQALGSLKSYIDTRYKISNDKNSMYRALHLINLSTNLTGNYTCKVSGFNTEDQKTKPMVIYKPATSGIDLIHNDVEKIILCSANGMYPQPDMNLYVFSEDGKNIILEDTDDSDDIILHDNDTYNITKEINYSDKELPSAAKLVCRLSIPGTTYNVEKSEPYLHGQASSSCNPIYLFNNDTLEVIANGNTNSCTPLLQDNTACSISLSAFLILLSLCITLRSQSIYN